MSTSDEEMLVVRSLRQAFESYGGPGSSVNATQNPFFIQMSGQFDLAKAAQLVLTNLKAQREHKAVVAKAEAARVAKELALATQADQTQEGAKTDPLA